MRRVTVLAAALCSLPPLLLLSGCRIEQTPAEYLDYEESIQSERRAAADELGDRLRAFVAAVGRGDETEALISLHPAEDVRLIGPGEDMDVVGAAAARLLLSRIAATPVAVRLRDVDVEVGPSANVAWFTVVVEGPGSEPEPALYRATGVYLREGGLWTLHQAHVAGLITPSAELPSNPSETAADSAEAE
jgi:hypothetical protein